MTIFPLQATFSRGEATPRLHARADIDHWRAMLERCLNFIVMRQGGLRRRPGTQFISKAKKQSESDKVRIAPFIFSQEQSYVLELGDYYMRVFGLGGQVFSGGSPYEISTPWTADQVMELQFAQSADVIYATHKSVPTQKIKRISETNWVIEAAVIEDGPYLPIPKSTTVFEPASRGKLTGGTYSASSGTASNAGDDNPATHWAATSAGAAWLQIDFGTAKKVCGYSIQADSSSEGFGAPRTWTFEGYDGARWVVLDTRAGETGWAEGEYRFYSFVNENAFTSYLVRISDVNDSSGSPEPARIADLALQGYGSDAVSMTLYATTTAGINGGSGFVASDVGRHIRVLSSAAYWHWFQITAVSSTTNVTAKIMSPPLPNTTSMSTWRLGAFSATTGYPARVCFYQDRLTYARTNSQPQTIWMSRTGSYDDFGTSIPLVDDDAISLTIGEVGEIMFIAEGRDLIIGTDAAVRTLGSNDTTKAFSATNFKLGKPQRRGVEPIQPVDAGDSFLCISRFGKAMREIIYSFENDGIITPDASVLSEHLFRSGIVSLSYAREPNANAWMTTGDGRLISLTYEREQEMVGFTDCALGGTDAFAEWNCTIPGEGRHETWVCAWRTGVGRTIERISNDFESDTSADAFFVDCGLTYSGTPVSTVSGLSHLNGQTVEVLADGANEPSVTVSGGSITLASGRTASKIHVGLGYQSKVRTLRVANGGRDGTLLGRKKNVRHLIVDVLQAGAFLVRASGTETEEAIRRGVNDLMGSALSLFTGTIKVNVDDRWDGGGVVEVENDGPQPITIRAISPAFEPEP